MKEKEIKDLPDFAGMSLLCSALSFVLIWALAATFNEQLSFVLTVLFGIAYMLHTLVTLESAVLLSIIHHHQQKGAIVIAGGIKHDRKNPYVLATPLYLAFMWWWVIVLIVPPVMYSIGYVPASNLAVYGWRVWIFLACMANVYAALIAIWQRYKLSETES